MSGMRITGPRPSIVEDQSTRPIRPSKGGETERSAPASAPVAKENFITALVAARRPPALPIGEILGAAGPSATSKLFAKELQSFNTRDSGEVAADLASIYLDHVEDALDTGSADLAEAFETLGELMRGYEHLRMLRTGELG